MSKQNPTPTQNDSASSLSLPILVGAEPQQYTAELEAEINRIRQSSIFEVAQRDRDLFAWLSSKRDARINGYINSNCYVDLLESCRFYQHLYCQKRGHLHTIPAPVIFAEISPFASPTVLYSDILRELGNPFAHGRLPQLRTRSWGTLKSYQVRLLIIGKGDFLNYKTLNELTELTRNLKIAIVLVGTYHFRSILKQETKRYADIYNTFLDWHVFPPFQEAEITGIIRQWETQVL